MVSPGLCIDLKSRPSSVFSSARGDSQRISLQALPGPNEFNRALSIVPTPWGLVSKGFRSSILSIITPGVVENGQLPFGVPSCLPFHCFCFHFLLHDNNPQSISTTHVTRSARVVSARTTYRRTGSSALPLSNPESQLCTVHTVPEV